MAKDQQAFSRQHALAREVEKKLSDRENALKAKIKAILPKESLLRQNMAAVFAELVTPELETGKKPSEIIGQKLPWLFDLAIYPRFREAFLQMADRVREFPYAIGWGRRSFRSESYVPYDGRLRQMLLDFQDVHCLDADICDVLTGNLPEDMLAYLSTRNSRPGGFPPEVLAYALDRGNPRLEAIVTDIVNGQETFSKVSWALIRGIVLSRNPRMHQLLCRLLLAAKLQEGLRQSICECADWGTIEAFTAIVKTIRDHDLIRYSSVKRAVGTWVGLMTEDSKDLDRISGKTLDILCRCLEDPPFRESCLDTQDAMAIHLALWSEAFTCAETGIRTLHRLIREGTHQQVLAAGFFVAQLEDPALRHRAAAQVLQSRRERRDLLAVYLPHFLPEHQGIASTLVFARQHVTPETYFDNCETAGEFCRWLFSLYEAMDRKEQEFSPCIFPWHRAVLKKSDLLEKAMVIAALIKDGAMIDALCPHLPQCDPDNRPLLLQLLTKGAKTAAIRQAILNGMQDKSESTRRVAIQQAKGLALTEAEYRKTEDMLRLRYEDLRRGCLALLRTREEAPLEQSIARLLASSKTQQRTAGLDLLNQLQKEEKTKALAQRCMAYVRQIQTPTTQEQVLIDALIPQEDPLQAVQNSGQFPLLPVVLDDYALGCVDAFMTVFPQSRLKEQVLRGAPVSHDAQKRAVAPCPAAEKAKADLISLSNFFIAHETEPFTPSRGEEMPLGCSLVHFRVYAEGGRLTVPGMDLWRRWQQENHITTQDLYAMAVTLRAQPDHAPYLNRCGKYMADLYGSGFEIPMKVRYEGHLQQILEALMDEAATEHTTGQLAAAIGIWIARCVPDEMLLGGDKAAEPLIPAGLDAVWKQLSDAQRSIFGTRALLDRPASHFIAHPQVGWLLQHLVLRWDDTLCHRVPLVLHVYERTFRATRAYMEKAGTPVTGRNLPILRGIYREPQLQTQPTIPRPDAGAYLYAYYFGFLSEQALYGCLTDPSLLKQALELLTSVQVGANGKRLPSFASFRITRVCENFLGKAPQPRLIAAMEKIAATLVGTVVEAELRRGDTPTPYSAYVTGIEALSGAEIFVGILRALGKDTLDRSVYYWGNSDTRRGTLSYLLSRCVPAPDDTAETLEALLKTTDITPKRLIEAALYSPGWIDIIGAYLGLPGFKSACYYFMAHMNEQFGNEKKAVIARFSPLSEEELCQGAFDVEWFHSAYAQLGEETFNLIYDAAKYICESNKHTRARKYADAALGRLDADATRAAIADKRNKDLLMAYGIIPLAGEEDLMGRYLYLQQFLKESRQFGAQRAASEKSAVEMALRNLSTNAGYSDTLRLTLRMETKLVQDNRALFAERAVGDWVFRLEVDDWGNPGILCSKGGKLLKSVPAQAKKDPYVARLLDMKKQLAQQQLRTRRMFEEAMEDGALFRLDELRLLGENPVAAPILEKLVLGYQGRFGLLKDGTLTDLQGAVVTEDPCAELTVSHPVQLHQAGCWVAFQRYLFGNRIAQPFRQVFREVYVKTGEELDRMDSLRYAGHQIQPKKAAAGWQILTRDSKRSITKRTSWPPSMPWPTGLPPGRSKRLPWNMWPSTTGKPVRL